MSFINTAITSYHHDGYAHLGQLIPKSECDKIRKAVTDWVGPQPDTNIYGILRNNCWLEIPILKDALHQNPLGKHAALILDQPNVILFQDNLIWKPPQTSQKVEWHQDYAYWPLNKPAGITFWIALDDTDEENGCIHVIPGTHKLGERAATNFTEPGAAPWSSQHTPMDLKSHQDNIVAVPMTAGQVLAFHPLLWHMSPANTSNRNRRAWSLTWITDAVRWDPEHAPHPFCYWLQIKKGDTIQGTQFLSFSR